MNIIKKLRYVYYIYIYIYICVKLYEYTTIYDYKNILYLT